MAVSPLFSAVPRWHTLADAIAAKLLGNGKVPDVVDAIQFYADELDDAMQSTMLRGTIPLDPYGEVFQTVVEQRQLAKNAPKGDTDAKRLDMALKIMANSGAYGIFAEVNVVASKTAPAGTVYSDTTFDCPNVHHERPGRYCHPLLASLVTGGARLMLAMAEAEVTRAGGTFAFCDTDSLAIVTGPSKDPSVPWITVSTVESIIGRFDRRLNPYKKSVVTSLLKPEYDGVNCWAISAKRYCLYRYARDGTLIIVKASESGLGAILGRTDHEHTASLARRVWTVILHTELKLRVKKSRAKRLRQLLDFDVPLRRKLPLTQPNVLSRDSIRRYNASSTYANRIKPFNFVQVLTFTVIFGEDVLPMAPFEKDLTRSKRLPWIDLRSGHPVRIDWERVGHADSIPVMRLDQYIDEYRQHPEAKAADEHGNSSGPETRGLLHRLVLSAGAPTRIGKEVDRVDEAEGTSLDDEGPIRYEVGKAEALRLAIKVLEKYPQALVAERLRISVRRWRDIVKERAKPRPQLRDAIIRLARSGPAGNE